MKIRVYSLGPVPAGAPGVPALPEDGRVNTCVALAGGAPPKFGRAGGVGAAGWFRFIGGGVAAGLPKICVNSPGAPSGFEGVGPCGGKENGVDEGLPLPPADEGDGLPPKLPPPELNIRVNSPG